jgi:hypothetical protein
LVDESIVLALRGGAEMRSRQGKRRGGGELRAETLHGLQNVLGAAEDVPPIRREVLEAATHPLDCLRRGEVEMGVEGHRPESADGTGGYFRTCPTQQPTRLAAQLRPLGFPDFLATGDLMAFGFW